jgi:hypothetical protein
LNERLEGEGAALEELARRLAEVEADRDRLAAEVDGLLQTRDQLEARLGELGDGEPRAAIEEVSPAAEPPIDAADRPRALRGSLQDPMREQGTDDGEPAGARPADTEASPNGTATAGAPAAASADPPEASWMIRFNSTDGTVADGVQAYRDGDFVTAARIWEALAASGDSRAQFHFGALLYEGRTAEPDLVMAYVWLSRAVDGGYFPAIDLRRQVRAAMSEAEYQEALTIRSNS